MTAITKDTADLETALAGIDELGLPESEVLDAKWQKVPTLRELDDDMVEQLRRAPHRTNKHRIYMAWRRFSALRLSAQGYTYEEIAAKMGVSTTTISKDITAIREKYADIAKKDWALLVEDRVMRLDADIEELRRIIEYLPDRYVETEEDYINLGPDIDQRLRIMDRIIRLEEKRDKLLGLDSAASARYAPEQKVSVTLSFDQNIPAPALPESDVIDL